ncbi:MAG: hypothetical protein L0G99_02455 [Propionibacteriales bacterium]|nr:hypothetical protein [Propionibacteriales bacterium]
MTADPPRFGVNYTPRTGWFHSWQDLDLAEVHRDFTALAGLGLDHVRIFGLWPLLQPSRSLIRRSALDDVASVVQVAADCGLQVAVDVLQGHMSSFDFVPAWLTSWHRRNLFTDPLAVAAERELAAAIGAAVAEVGNVFAITAGNETNQFAMPYHPDPQNCSPAEMGDWLDGMVAAPRPALPEAWSLHSFDSAAWFDDRCPVIPAHATTIGEATTVHCWVFTGMTGVCEPGDPLLATLADYQVQLAIGAAADADRPVWLQEIGAPQPWVPADGAARFVADSLQPLLTSPQVFGVTWWCSHDVSRQLVDFPELEHSLGLIDERGEIKPAGRAIAELIASAQDIVRTPRGTAVVFPASDTSTGAGRAVTAPGGPVWRAWQELRAAGTSAALVSSDLADDQHELAARGITDVIRPR